MKYAIATGALCLSALSVSAAEPSVAALTFAREQAAAWINHPAIITAIHTQNASTAVLAQDDINTLDRTWRAEVGTPNAPTIAAVINTPASEHLRANVAANNGMITEVFVMDARGLNVASSGVTSDYWQGDEAKWIETYMKGPDAVHVSNIEFDESTQTYQMQVSLPVSDPDDGTVIGAVTFGINAQSFF
ncbi:cache domain-containing protein [Tateyamaria sp. SN6-1]|uniref:cache domain-containing protein n=1 Tax=Tateyamaria sp. SN6-1 TaxID=3092148 RepID=UPI0039F49FCF